MNSQFVRDQATAFARRVAQRPSREQIGFAHVAAYGRLPSDTERQIAKSFVDKFRSEASGTDIRQQAMTAYCHALMCSAEFSIID